MLMLLRRDCCVVKMVVAVCRQKSEVRLEQEGLAGDLYGHACLTFALSPSFPSFAGLHHNLTMTAALVCSFVHILFTVGRHTACSSPISEADCNYVTVRPVSRAIVGAIYYRQSLILSPIRRDYTANPYGKYPEHDMAIRTTILGRPAAGK